MLLKAFQDNSNSTSISQRVRELTSSIIDRVKRLPGNQFCCDCGAPGKYNKENIPLGYQLLILILYHHISPNTHKCLYDNNNRMKPKWTLIYNHPHYIPKTFWYTIFFINNKIYYKINSVHLIHSQYMHWWYHPQDKKNNLIDVHAHLFNFFYRLQELDTNTKMPTRIQTHTCTSTTRLKHVRST